MHLDSGDRWSDEALEWLCEEVLVVVLSMENIKPSLKYAILTNDTKTVQNYKNAYKEKIRFACNLSKDSREKILHDEFSTAHVSESMKNIIFDGVDRVNKMVVAGRYVVFIFLNIFKTLCFIAFAEMFCR